MAAKLRRKVLVRITVGDDVEVHVSTIRSADKLFIEFRQYILSLKEYGRGVLVPHSAGQDIARAVAVARMDQENHSGGG